jgi:hypothetical protein
VFAFAGCKQAWAAFAIGRPLRHADFDGWLARVSTCLCQAIIETASIGAGRDGNIPTVGSSSSCAGCDGVSAMIDLHLGPVTALVRMLSFTCLHAGRPEPS